MQKTWDEIQEELSIKLRKADAARAERFAYQRELEAKKAARKAERRGMSHFRSDGRFVLGYND